MSWSVVIILSAILLAGNSDQVFPDNRKEEISLTYTGNMGVLIRSENMALWIDGIHEYYGPAYLQTPEDVLKKAFAGEDDFRNLNFVLFTHYHKDHFSKTLTTQLLRKKKDIRVIGAPQVTDSFDVSEIIPARGRDGEIFSDKSSALRIKAFDIPHSWAQRHSQVHNQAYHIELDGIRILHLSDAEADAEALKKLFQQKTDVLIVPVWFLTGNRGKDIISETGIKKVIVTHIDPRSVTMKVALPGVETVYFTEPGDVVRIACP